MTNVNLNSNQTGLTGGVAARRVPFLLRRREPKRSWPLPAPSLRVPVTRANRECLRAMRQSEMEAWLTKPGLKRGGKSRTLPPPPEGQQQNAPRLLPVVAVVTFIALAVGMLVSQRVPERLTEMVSLARAFLVQF